MNISMRSSQSSYGDPRYLSTMTASDAPAPVPPHGKTLVDGYRDALDPQHEERSRYNPVSTNTTRQPGIPANHGFFISGSSIRLTREAQLS